ncbi:MFS transporter [Edaphobacter modestus]|uniref:MFS transporter n=1 Tax=Edaphobacter modestus TaxID=388466 RepID=UPI001F5F4674|nr:MFS transporter [Edaphobacter modestus]
MRKRWTFVLPAAFITYSLAYLDRANYGFGAAAGLAETLHITGSQSSLLGALFFLGYFIFQIPGAQFARTHSSRWLIFTALITWGSLAALTGVIRTFWLLALDRFLLGIAESVILPAMLLLLTRWFTREERSRANSILILGNPITVLWMSAITGYLIQSFGWQKTFIFEGIPSVAWALAWILLVRDRPADAGWLDADAALALEERLAEEQRSLEPVKSLKQALLRRDVLLLSVQYFCWSLGVYGFVLWLPTIVRQGSSMSMGETGLLSAIPYLASIILMIVVSYLSDKTLRREALVWPFLLLSGIALLGSFLLANRSFPAAFACLVLAGGCMYAPYGPFFAIVPERLPKNVAAEVLALINSSGALGAFAGSYLVGLLQALTGSSRPGFLLMALALICSSFLILALPKTPQRNRAPQN